LTLYFLGDVNNLEDTTGVFNGIHQDQMYVALEDGDSNVGIVKYPDMNDVKQAFWHEWDIDLGDPCLSTVDMNNVAKVYLGFGGLKIGQTQPGAGMDWGYEDTVYFDDIRLYPPRCVPEHAPVGDITGDCTIDGYDLKIMAGDWLASDYYTDGNDPIYHPLESPAELYSEEPEGDRVINFKDYGIMADNWLAEFLWP
jgi:hypothetical protein